LGDNILTGGGLLINNLSHTFKSALSTSKRQTNMPSKHPYISSAATSIPAIIEKLKSAFPRAGVTVATLKQLQIAPSNESSLVNILKFVGIIDSEGKRTKEASAALFKSDEKDFFKSFEPLVKKSYFKLFDLHGDSAWGLSKKELVGFFRGRDETGAATGDRQASTFMVLASLCGRREPLAVTKDKPKKHTPPKAKDKVPTAKSRNTSSVPSGQNPGLAKDKTIGLAVKVEINLPAGGSKETYDNIFKSIRENLLDD